LGIGDFCILVACDGLGIEKFGGLLLLLMNGVGRESGEEVAC
jgi:hypothetical protein